MSSTKLTTCLWFDDQAEDVANFYTSIFPNSETIAIQRYTSAGQELHKKEPGSVMVVNFSLNGNPFIALNGGGDRAHTGATSFMINCETQDEIDHYWSKLGEGSDAEKQRCGWLTDKFGITWQVTPKVLPELMGGGDRERATRVMAAMMGMKKMDIEGLKRAAEGKE